MTLQANTVVDGDPRKYAVGVVLLFVSNNLDNPPDCNAPFGLLEPLVVLPTNGCGMGIDVRRVRDGQIDMVWPEEVCLP